MAHNSCSSALVAASLVLAIPATALPARADEHAVATAPYGTLTTAPVKSDVADRLAIRLIAHEEATKNRLPYDLVDSVIKIESDYRPDRIGDVGEIGLMQVRPATAAMLGFHGTPKDLIQPAVNIHYGALYLGQAWRLANGDVCRTLMKYRAGHGQEVMSLLSSSYCARARAHLQAMGSPLFDSISAVNLKVTEAESVAAPASIKVSALPGHSRNSAAYWAKFEARIKKINMGIEAKWRRLASR